jgi:hypothetical protein
MRASRRASIQVEAIESRALLSAIGPGPAHAAAEVAPQIYPPPLLLTGQVRGGGFARHDIPDAGSVYFLQGTGRVGPMGRVSAQGVFETTSFAGQPIGHLVLTDRHGQVELQLIGRPATSPSDLPQEWNFTVTRATGQYDHLEGTGGKLELHVGWAPNGSLAFRMEINPVVILAR